MVQAWEAANGSHSDPPDRICRNVYDRIGACHCMFDLDRQRRFPVFDLTSQVALDRDPRLVQADDKWSSEVI